MGIVNILAEKAAPYWEETTKKPFINEMALGTLSSEKFRNYMLQDYLYLLDYVDVLKKMKSMFGEITMELVYRATLIALYLKYSTEGEFLPQFENNITELVSQFSIIDAADPNGIKLP